jgi:hypothetical protein
MITGLRKHSDYLEDAFASTTFNSIESVTTRIQQHLDAMSAVKENEIRWRVALDAEAKLEKETAALVRRVASLLMSVYGDRSPKLRDFGIEPRKKPKIGVETMRLAVEKRRETRRLRGTMGKKQRKKIKGQA